MDIFDYFIILLVVILEGALIYINYLARIKLGMREINPIWRKFDLKRGRMKLIGFILHPILVLGMVLIIIYLPRNIFGIRGTYLYIGILIGYLLFNFWYDFWTLYNFRKRWNIKSIYSL